MTAEDFDLIYVSDFFHLLTPVACNSAKPCSSIKIYGVVNVFSYSSFPNKLLMSVTVNHMSILSNCSTY